VQQALPACAIGLVIGFIAVRTCSLIPCITFHFVYNALTVGIALIPAELAAVVPGGHWLFVTDAVAFGYAPAVTLGGAILSAGILAVFFLSPDRPYLRRGAQGMARELMRRSSRDLGLRTELRRSSVSVAAAASEFSREDGGKYQAASVGALLTPTKIFAAADAADSWRGSA
jgi:hypothetical protein